MLPSKGAAKRDPAAPPRLAFNGKVRPGKPKQPEGVPTQSYSLALM